MTLYNNFLLKRGVGLFSRVGLISGDYGSCSQWWCTKLRREGIVFAEGSLSIDVNDAASGSPVSLTLFQVIWSKAFKQKDQ